MGNSKYRAWVVYGVTSGRRGVTLLVYADSRRAAVLAFLRQAGVQIGRAIMDFHQQYRARPATKSDLRDFDRWEIERRAMRRAQWSAACAKAARADARERRARADREMEIEERVSVLRADDGWAQATEDEMRAWARVELAYSRVDARRLRDELGAWARVGLYGNASERAKQARLVAKIERGWRD